jgi:hypothetical protein
MHVACATKKGAIVISAVLLFGVMNALFEFVLLSMKVEPAVIDNRIDNSSNRSVGLQCSFRF